MAATLEEVLTPDLAAALASVLVSGTTGRDGAGVSGPGPVGLDIIAVCLRCRMDILPEQDGPTGQPGYSALAVATAAADHQCAPRTEDPSPAADLASRPPSGEG